MRRRMHPYHVQLALDAHELWLEDKSRGVYADLTNADLSGLDLRYCKMSMAILTNVNLADTDLEGADLSYAHLRGANLCRTKLIWTILDWADTIDTGYQPLQVVNQQGYVVPHRLQIGYDVVFLNEAVQALLGRNAEQVFCEASSSLSIGKAYSTKEIWRVYSPSIQGAIRTSMAAVPKQWKGERG